MYIYIYIYIVCDQRDFQYLLIITKIRHVARTNIISGSGLLIGKQDTLIDEVSGRGEEGEERKLRFDVEDAVHFVAGKLN